MRVAAWKIEASGPIRIPTAELQLEGHLEQWIEHDPSLVTEGLRIVARQVVLEGGRLDLLGLDAQGRWVLIEIKRARLYRDVVTQALDYASSLARLPAEMLRAIIERYLREQGADIDEHPAMSLLASADADEARDISVIVVGTGKDAGLDRLVTFLGEKYNIPIQVVTFEVLALADGERLLIREVTESEPQASAGWTLPAVLARAEASGVGESLRVLIEAAERHGLYPRPWKQSVMFTPPSNRSRMLFTGWLSGKPGELRMYVSPEAFAEFFPLAVEAVVVHLGSERERIASSPSDARGFVAELDALFAEIATAPAPR